MAPPVWAGDDVESTRPAEEAESIFEFLLLSYDGNGDGKVVRKEYTRDDAHWARLDVNKDGVLTATDFAGRRRRGRPDYRSRRRATPPAQGEKAPNFDLEVIVPNNEEGKGVTDEVKKTKKGKQAKPKRVSLSGFAKKKRPVALIFGSYT